METSLSSSQKRSFFMTYLVFFLNGLLALSIGSLMPFIREARGLDYVFCGLLVSIHSVGNLFSSFFAGILPIKLGRKKSLLLFNLSYPVAYTLILAASKRPILLIAFFLTGLARGATSNYSNARINDLLPGKVWTLNGLHASFSLGALLFPLMLSILTQNADGYWMAACAVMLVCGLFSWLLYFFMPADDFNSKKMEKKEKGNSNLGFFQEPLFYVSTATLFFYLCAEQGVIGWMITYFKDTELLTGQAAQMTATVQWIMMLCGRLTVAYFSTKVDKFKMLHFMGYFMAFFFIFLLLVNNPVLIMFGIMGFGFSMAGIYPTTVSLTGKLTSQYPVAWSFILTFASFGSILMPSIVGAVATKMGIKLGIATIAVAVVLDVIAILAFTKKVKQRVVD